MSVNKKWIPYARVLTHVLCLVPLARLILSTLGLFGFELGPNPVEELLHALGWWGLVLLMASLSITPARKLLIQPWLQVLRRPLGLYAFFYALLHFVVYVVLDRELDFATIGEDIAKRPYILIGLLALLLLVPLAITSTKSWIRRLGRKWQKLHYLVYPATALAVWHFFWQVKQDVLEPLIFVAVLLVLFGYRVQASFHKRRSSR